MNKENCALKLVDEIIYVTLPRTIGFQFKKTKYKRITEQEVLVCLNLLLWGHSGQSLKPQ